MILLNILHLPGLGRGMQKHPKPPSGGIYCSKGKPKELRYHALHE
jgi:hypothetical protein